MFLPHPRVKVSIVGSLRDREAACSASDRQGSNFKSCVWRTVSSQSSHHPQEVLLAQFLYVHKGGLKPDSFHFIKAGQLIDSIHTIVYSNSDAYIYAISTLISDRHKPFKKYINISTRTILGLLSKIETPVDTAN